MEQNIDQSKKQLQAERDMMENFLKLVKNIILAIDENYTVIFINKEGCDVLGYDKDEILGKNWFEQFVPEWMTPPPLQEFPSKMISTIQTKKGKERIISWHNTIWRDTKDKDPHILRSGQDITERQRAEEKLAVLHEWAKLLNRAENLNAVFNHTLHAIEKTLGFEYAVIWLKQGKHLHMTKSKGYTSFPKNLRRLSLKGDAIPVRSLKKSKTIITDEISKKSSHFPLDPNIKSEIASPIKIGQNVLGVLYIEDKKKNAFEQRDKRLLDILASHVAVAIKEVEEKERRKSLQQKKELRDDFITTAAKELGDPVKSLRESLDMLNKIQSGNSTESSEISIDNALQKVRTSLKEYKQTEQKEIEKYQRKVSQLSNKLDRVFNTLLRVFPELQVLPIITRSGNIRIIRLCKMVDMRKDELMPFLKELEKEGIIKIEGRKIWSLKPMFK